MRRVRGSGPFLPSRPWRADGRPARAGPAGSQERVATPLRKARPASHARSESMASTEANPIWPRSQVRAPVTHASAARRAAKPTYRTDAGRQRAPTAMTRPPPMLEAAEQQTGFVGDARLVHGRPVGAVPAQDERDDGVRGLPIADRPARSSTRARRCRRRRPLPPRAGNGAARRPDGVARCRDGPCLPASPSRRSTCHPRDRPTRPSGAPARRDGASGSGPRSAVRSIAAPTADGASAVGSGSPRPTSELAPSTATSVSVASPPTGTGTMRHPPDRVRRVATGRTDVSKRA